MSTLQFNPMESIKLSHHDYIDSPSLKDRIHCVAFVFDVNSIEHFSSQMIEKIRRLRRELINAGVVHVALLTHVDSMDLITKGDLIEIDRCVPLRSKVMNDALRKHIFWGMLLQSHTSVYKNKNKQLLGLRRIIQIT